MNIRSKVLGIYTFALVCVLASIIFISYPYVVSSQGADSVKIFVIVIAAVGLLSVLISALLLEVVVIRRISNLTEQVDHIKDYRSFYEKLKFSGGDEVAALANAVNNMLERIVGSTNEVNDLNAELQQEKADEEKLVEKRTKELSMEKARLQASVTNLSLGFIMTDQQNNILLINDSAKAILEGPGGDSAASQPGINSRWTITGIDNYFDNGFLLAPLLVKSLQDGKPVESADVTCNTRILRILISPVIDQSTNERLGCVVLLEDITERKVLERSKDEFLSIASHELRTPLTAIRGNTAMIKQFYEPQVNDTAFNEMVEDIHQSSVRLISIVNDFLDASRLEQGKIKFKIEPFDLTTVLEGVSYETSNLAQEKDTRIVIDTTLQSIPKVNADKDRVKQIVYNLVGNALRFTEHGSITLTAQKQGDMIKVFVTDTGPGISEEDQRRLFHKFQQAGSNLFTRETSRGTGLGLYISKLLVEGMGGVIGIDHSEIGKGTTFAFTLPIASDTSSPSSASQAGEASAA